MVLESRSLEFGSKLPHIAPKVTWFLGCPFELDVRAYIDLYCKSVAPARSSSGRFVHYQHLKETIRLPTAPLICLH